MSLFSLGWSLATGWIFSVDQMILILCTISNMIFLFTVNLNSCTVSEETRVESLSESILWKQLQSLRWKSMFNKALAMHQIRREMRSMSPDSMLSVVEPKNFKSLDSDLHGKKPKKNETYFWKSCSGGSSPTKIPDFHASDCMNIDNNNTPALFLLAMKQEEIIIHPYLL
jgi:hypothetical protein